MSSSRNLSDSAEFIAVMSGGEIAPRRPNDDRNYTILLPGSGHKPIHTHPVNRRSHPPHNLQTVRFLSPYISCTLILICSLKKYSTIVKGFKILEANLEESKKNLAVSEETVRVARVAYAELASEVEACRASISHREQVRRYLGGENRSLKLNTQQEIKSLREDLGNAQQVSNDREQVQHCAGAKNLC